MSGLPKQTPRPPLHTRRPTIPGRNSTRRGRGGSMYVIERSFSARCLSQFESARRGGRGVCLGKPDMAGRAFQCPRPRRVELRPGIVGRRVCSETDWREGPGQTSYGCQPARSYINTIAREQDRFGSCRNSTKSFIPISRIIPSCCSSDPPPAYRGSRNGNQPGENCARVRREHTIVQARTVWSRR
jgi:hypothetical protein